MKLLETFDWDAEYVLQPKFIFHNTAYINPIKYQITVSNMAIPLFQDHVLNGVLERILMK